MKTFVKLMAVATVMVSTSAAFATVGSLSKGMNATTTVCKDKVNAGRFADTSGQTFASAKTDTAPVKGTKVIR
ncbi:hypothetical protein [Bdellovibrio sp. HCB2-146]|uniref:hypothetical protein n=1 Tax=Bdellovibrio sp. HCB2-146 TaxID=3394362 RepID=UPI0039BCF3D2